MPSLPALPGSPLRRPPQYAMLAYLVWLVPQLVAWAPLPDDAVVDAAALRLIEARSELKGRPLWPGFDPLAYPLAVYDGGATLLVDHPAPPAAFKPLPGVSGVLFMEGHHELVNANSSIQLGGLATATLMLESLDLSDPLAGVAVAAHEAFHVYQGLHYPGWVADESQLFLCAMDNAHLLALRRTESLAWRRALLADEGLPWAAAALERRRQRNALRSDGAVGYERGLELKEGLARYVQDRCLPEQSPEAAPAGGWPAEAVRLRAYASGATMAHLLDRCAAGWKEGLVEEDGAFLDDLLGRALAGQGVVSAEFSADELRRIESLAEIDAAAVASSRQQARAAFLAREGAAIVVQVSGGRPLSPQGFDPLNVRSLGGQDVLHTRWLKLLRHDAAITIEGRSVLTEGTGSHPLFGGVRELVLTGLAEPPRVDEDGPQTMVSAPGFEGRFTGVHWERQGKLLIITLP